MLLDKKIAVIYGAGGAIGGAVARAFAEEGARVYLTGRNLASVAAVAEEISASGGAAEAAQVDALDERAVEEHIAAVANRLGISPADASAKIAEFLPLVMSGIAKDGQLPAGGTDLVSQADGLLKSFLAKGA